MHRLSILTGILALSTACGVEVYLNEHDADDLIGTPELDTPETEADPVRAADLVIATLELTETDDDPVEDDPIEDELGDELSTQIFDSPGESEWVVPTDVAFVRIEAWGGGGAGGNQQGATGGGGAWIEATVPVTAGEVLYVQVAEGGLDRGDGGGASWLLTSTEVLAVAAGGGGGGSDGCSGCKTGGAGGAGGGAVGQSGQDLVLGFNGYCDAATGGEGASQTVGGLGGQPQGFADYPCDGEPGAEGRGGMASGVWGNCEAGNGATGWQSGGGQGNGGGGAGGAGWYGGGGAGFIWTYCSGGGGGGSSWAHPTATGVTLIGGAAQDQGMPGPSGGAGRGGDVLGAGGNGAVLITPILAAP